MLMKNMEFRVTDQYDAHEKHGIQSDRPSLMLMKNMEFSDSPTLMLLKNMAFRVTDQV
jgi:hypothetical protein